VKLWVGLLLAAGLHASLITFTNSTSISISATGPADPLPSAIEVSGIESASAVTVSLMGLNHTTPNNIDVLLVGPGGSTMMILSDAGGTKDWSGVDLTLSDDAGSLLGSGDGSGTYLPTDLGRCTTAFPSPAPGGPYGHAARCGTDTLASIFLPRDVNGAWMLFVLDDAGIGTSGTMDGGWSLHFDAVSVPEPDSKWLTVVGAALLLARLRRVRTHMRHEDHIQTHREALGKDSPGLQLRVHVGGALPAVLADEQTRVQSVCEGVPV